MLWGQGGGVDGSRGVPKTPPGLPLLLSRGRIPKKVPKDVQQKYHALYHKISLIVP